MDLYTSKAANALKYAGKVAKKLHHSYIGSEHILLGLLRETDSMAGTILDGYGVYEEKIRELISQLIAPEATQAVMDPDGYTPRARRVLERAAQEASAAGHPEGTGQRGGQTAEYRRHRCPENVH